MIESKEWNWSAVTGDLWHTPSEDVYYYKDRWQNLGFKDFLDLGCGLGRHTLLFAKAGFRTEALDLSQEAVKQVTEKAQSHGLDVKAQVADINCLPYVAEAFDCLLAYHVISHTDTTGIRTIIGEMERVLKPGGECFFTLCSKNSPSFNKSTNIIVDANTRIKMEEPEVGIPHYYCELSDVKSLMASFELIRIRHIQDIFEDTSSWHYFIHARKRL